MRWRLLLMMTASFVTNGQSWALMGTAHMVSGMSGPTSAWPVGLAPLGPRPLLGMSFEVRHRGQWVRAVARGLCLVR